MRDETEFSQTAMIAKRRLKRIRKLEDALIRIIMSWDEGDRNEGLRGRIDEARALIGKVDP